MIVSLDSISHRLPGWELPSKVAVPEFVYFIQSSFPNEFKWHVCSDRFISAVRGRSCVKIGHSRAPTSRVRSLDSGFGNWTKTSVLLSIKVLCKEDALALERYFHLRFATLKIEGEWFESGKELCSFIDDLTGLGGGVCQKI